MGTIATLLFALAVILVVVAIIMAVTHRVWSNWLIGAVIAFAVGVVIQVLL